MNATGLSDLRILSLLPSATEMVCALGLLDRLVGITHSCDYPSEVREKPVVVHSRIPLAALSPGEIDAAVVSCLRSGQSVYELDACLIRNLAPTLIVSQGLCDVCAPGDNELRCALDQLPYTPEVLSMSPHRLEDIWENLRQLGAITGRMSEASALIQRSRARLDVVAKNASKIERRPRVFCMEWVDPVFCAGHWVPEMVELAGGQDVLGRKWEDSVRVTMEEVIASEPEVLIVMPCGCGTGEALQQASQMLANTAWEMIPAVRRNRVYAVDAARFSRPSLRLVEGIELLAHLLHPNQFNWNGPAEAFSFIPVLSVL